MHCPYCAEEIKDEAVVCKHCRRDFFVVRPMLQKVDELTKRLQEIEQVKAAAATVGEVSALASGPRARKNNYGLPTMSSAAALAYTFILLVLAHFIIIVHFDLSLVYLRIVSMVVPMAFGFLYQQQPRHHLPVAFAAGLAVAIVSILTMSGIVAKLDKVTVLPYDAAGWREVIEYTASITFGFFTGVLMRQSVILARSPKVRSNKFVMMGTRLVQQKLGITEGQRGIAPNRIPALIWTAVSAGSAITSIVTGLRQFLS